MVWQEFKLCILSICCVFFLFSKVLKSAILDYFSPADIHAAKELFWFFGWFPAMGVRAPINAGVSYGQVIIDKVVGLAERI
jgi:hypothetical protein